MHREGLFPESESGSSRHGGRKQDAGHRHNETGSAKSQGHVGAKLNFESTHAHLQDVVSFSEMKLKKKKHPSRKYFMGLKRS